MDMATICSTGSRCLRCNVEAEALGSAPWRARSFVYLAISATAAPAGAQGYDPTARGGASRGVDPLDPRASPQGDASSPPKYDPNDEFARYAADGGRRDCHGAMQLLSFAVSHHAAAALTRALEQRDPADGRGERHAGTRSARTGKSFWIIWPAISRVHPSQAARPSNRPSPPPRRSVCPPIRPYAS